MKTVKDADNQCGDNENSRWKRRCDKRCVAMRQSNRKV